jgi:hypothetical protein
LDQNQIDSDLIRQRILNKHIAGIIAAHNDTTLQLVIRRAFKIGLKYEQATKMSAKEAEAAYVDRPAPPSRTFTIVCLGLLLITALALGKCIFGGSSQTSSTAGSEVYARCEAELKPKLQSCLASGRDDTHEACGEAYMARMSECTGGR